ncbi:hypothetical protein AB0F91_20500 [Amycolatopsis sp. NPDC023774]|uniref:hypothetical protein n=1 Tax=Amycolatopsis sp. NPDC023774 TaxID=3155015 RepID=UPI0033FEE5BF
MTVRGGSRNDLKPTGKATAPEGGSTSTMRVAGIYRDLRSLPDQQYWCSLVGLYRGSPLSNTGTYPVALVSPGARTQDPGDPLGQPFHRFGSTE